MLDLELTPRTARREHFRRKNKSEFAAEHEALFILLTTLRAASASSLYTLYFSRRSGATTRRQTTRDLGRLVELGLLERQALTGNRSVYRLTSRSYCSSPRVHRRTTEAIRAPLADHLGGYCWLRAAMWAELTIRGYCVGRGKDELRALRRFLVDRQRAIVAAASGPARAESERVLAALRADDTLTPLSRARCSRCGDTGPLGVARARCARCGASTEQVVSELRFECARCGYCTDTDEPEHGGARRCTGTLREVDHLPFDVAWRAAGKSTEVVLVLVDNPERQLKEQLQALPLRIAGQPRVPIVLRTTDLHSVFEPVAGDWIAKGDRHRLLLRAFSEEGARRLFPFIQTAEVIDVRSDLQLRLRVNRKEATHE